MKLEIAERKHAEEALHHANNELELKVLERTAELRQAKASFDSLSMRFPASPCLRLGLESSFANRRELEFTGLTPHEVRSKDAIAKIFHAEDLKKLEGPS